MGMCSRDVISVMVACMLIGCDSPQVGQSGQPLVVEGVEFQLGDYEVRTVEIASGGEIHEYPRPVLALPLTVKNVGQASLIYNPGHQALSATEATTPLLYLDPGAEASLPPASKQLIPSVVLEKGALPGQVGTTTLEPGQSVSDVYLFEVPDAAVNLIFSVPPTMHRGKFPALVRWRYEPKTATGPKFHAVGESVEFDGVTVTVTKAELAYIRVLDNTQGEGFSSAPHYRINYRVENGSDAPVRYEPGHRAVGTRGAALFSAKDSLKRIRFPGNTSVVGQVDRATIEPGKSLEDFVIFDAPQDSTASLSFELPAAQFDRQGLARFELSYSHVEVAKPQELTKAP